MDNKVNFLRGTSAEYEVSTKDNDTFYYTTDTKKLYLGENEVGNGIDPKVIQAHIDNQTIHAKVWRGTQEEYNAIEPKEDDTVYIIKDSDNTLADKLIDDTSTTATDKTWSAKKINENDEVARTAINTHAGNDEIHVTAEEKAAWNAVNYSNPNLLINPDFRAPINQRGETTYGCGNYCIDRWYLYKTSTATTSGTLAIGNGCVMITSGGTSFDAYFKQFIENGDILLGQDVTLSVMVKEITGTWGCGQQVNVADVTTPLRANLSLGLNVLKGIWYGPDDSTAAQNAIYFFNRDSNSSISIEWAKLEIGSVATPFTPPDPATELAKCQRYFHRLGGNGRYFRLYGIAYGSHSLRFPYNLPVEMRTTPTLTCSPGNWRFCVSKIPSDGGHYWNNEYGTTFAVDGSYSSPSNVDVCVELDSSKTVTISEGDSVVLYTNNDLNSAGSQKYPGWLDFDAEIR